VAAPVRNAHGDVIASLSVSGPTFRFRQERRQVALERVRATAAELSARLGWRQPG
jgi:DNA-binding IclR family transcriptional regulator